MGLYILRRILMLIPILLGVSFLTFSIIKITPGDPVQIMLGMRATPEKVAEMRKTLGLDDPFLVQYGRYLLRVAQGDLGRSIRGGTPVLDEILLRFPSTLQLTLSALTLAVVTGVTAGVLAAQSFGRFFDRSAMLSALVAISIPEFWLAIVLIIIFGVQLKWISVTGGQGAKDLILPTICLALGPAAVLARLTRSSILEVIQEDYIRTARGKGVHERIIAYRHILRNALIPVVTVIGLVFAGLLGGAVFIENVFARPGLGRFAVNAIAARDFPQIQGMVLFTATVYALLNLVVDVLYAFIDPRIRYS
jgi:peptide/nickel transport system permease protein